MKIVKYAFLFLVCFVVSQYLLNTYYSQKQKSAIDGHTKSEKPYDQKTLSRISSPLLVDKGKVKSNFIEGILEVKNIGDFDLTDLKVSGDCSCTSIEFKNKNLIKGGVSTVYYKIDISKDKGWFNKTINLEGSFFPYKRAIRIEGYKL